MGGRDANDPALRLSIASIDARFSRPLKNQLRTRNLVA